jgi:hypothetical protein
MRAILPLLAFVVLAASVTTVASGLSEPAYLKAANKICAQRAEKLSKLPRLKLSKISTARLAVRLRKVITIYQPGTRLLRALQPPRSFSFLVPRWLHYEQLRIVAWTNARNAALQGKRARSTRYLKKSDVLGARAAEISTGLEIKDCE